MLRLISPSLKFSPSKLAACKLSLDQCIGKTGMIFQRNCCKDGKNDKGDKEKPQHIGPTPLPPKDPPPSGYNPEAVCHEALKVPDYIAPRCFRKFQVIDEPIGPCIKKDSEYKNAEYYAYHRFSYYDLKTQTLELAAGCAGDVEEEDKEN